MDRKKEIEEIKGHLMDSTNILDRYRHMMAESPTVNSLEGAEAEVLSEAEKILNSPLDMANAYIARNAEFSETPEGGLNVRHEKVTTFVRRAYCPDCGEEIVTVEPILFDWAIKTNVVKHRCVKCGKAMRLHHEYPRIVYLNDSGEEIEIGNGNRNRTK